MVAVDWTVVCDYVLGDVDDYVPMGPTTDFASAEVDMKLSIEFIKLHPIDYFIISTS